MRRVLDNRLLLVSFGLLALYWVTGPLFPRPTVSSAMSLLSIAAGSLMFSRYFEGFWGILFYQDRSETGSHWAIFGAALVSLGVIYSGGYSLLWIYFNEPKAWSGTTTSSFGRGLVAVGFWLMAISPDSSKVTAGYPYEFWRAFLILAAILVAFIAGTHYTGNGL